MTATRPHTSQWEQPQDRESFWTFVKDQEACIALARRLCEEADLPAVHIERASDGSLPVFFFNDSLVIKIYPTLYRDEWINEKSVLTALSNQLPCAVPELLASVEWRGWYALIMQRLEGTSALSVWDQLTQHEQMELSEQLGAALRILHQQTPPSPLSWDWKELYQERAQEIIPYHRSKGLPEVWCEQLRGFLERSLKEEEDTSPSSPVLLHTEVMRAHIFCKRPKQDSIVLSGILDFEPSMVGPRMYEFASVGLFWTQGAPHLLRQLCLGYGFQEHELDHTLQCRWMAQILLHRYSNLSWYFRFMPMQEDFRTFEQLASRWFAFQEVGECGLAP